MAGFEVAGISSEESARDFHILWCVATALYKEPIIVIIAATSERSFPVTSKSNMRMQKISINKIGIGTKINGLPLIVFRIFLRKFLIMQIEMMTQFGIMNV